MMKWRRKRQRSKQGPTRIKGSKTISRHHPASIPYRHHPATQYPSLLDEGIEGAYRKGGHTKGHREGKRMRIGSVIYRTSGTDKRRFNTYRHIIPYRNHRYVQEKQIVHKIFKGNGNQLATRSFHHLIPSTGTRYSLLYESYNMISLMVAER